MMRRLRSLSSHLRPDDGPPQRANASGAPPPDVLRAAVDRKFSDAQMKQFLTQGYMVIPIKDVEPDFHETIYQKAKTLYRAEDGGGVDFGNNVFPAVPEIGTIYQTPAVVGAISSVLGDSYVMHPHRHLHSRPFGEGGTSDQNFHMDSYWGMTRTRHHAPRWVMALYYPHDVTLESGPTGIIPFSQYYEMPDYREGLGELHQSQDLSERDAAIDETVKSIDPALNGMPVTVPGGSVVMMAYDVYHRGCRRRDDVADWRAMLKFQFVATGSRFEPSWNHDPGDDSAFELPQGMDGRHSVLWDSMLDFCAGRVDDAPVTPLPEDMPKTAADAAALLHSGTCEADHMGAAYTLARMVRGAGSDGSAALEQLVQTLASKDGEDVLPIGQNWRDDVRRAAMYGLSASGMAAVPSLLALATSDASTTVRVAAVHAMSEATTQPSDEVGDALIGLLEPTRAAIVASAEDEADQLKLLHATVLQSLGFIGTRAFGLGQTELSDRIADSAMVPCMLEQEPTPGMVPVDTGNTSRQQTRQNAALGLLMLCNKIQDAQKLDTAVDAMASCTNDKDRYVMGYAYEGIRLVSEAELVAGGSDVDLTAVAQQELLNKVTYERWCPETGAGVSSF